jgi:uncharacterized Zn finger protein
MGYYDYGYWQPYVSVGQRRAKAQKEIAKLKKQGYPVSPVIIEGTKIATTFWGKAWCDNLEGYSTYENRLPRGRSYVKNGLVLDLQIAPGQIDAQVSGSRIYTVEVSVSAVRPAQWKALCKDCAQGIDSLVDLLQGRFSKGVMERLCLQHTGLFPAPSEITFNCSCPDGGVNWMCKHIAAVLYGVGARLDHQPELLFTLRKVDGNDLLASAGGSLPLSRKAPSAKKVLGGEGLSDLFGIELAEASEPAAPKRGRASKPATAEAKAKPASVRAAKPAAASAPVKARSGGGSPRVAKVSVARAEARVKTAKPRKGSPASASRKQAASPKPAARAAARAEKPAAPGPTAVSRSAGQVPLASVSAALGALMKTLAAKL